MKENYKELEEATIAEMIRYDLQSAKIETFQAPKRLSFSERYTKEYPKLSEKEILFEKQRYSYVTVMLDIKGTYTCFLRNFDPKEGYETYYEEFRDYEKLHEKDTELFSRYSLGIALNKFTIE